MKFSISDIFAENPDTPRRLEPAGIYRNRPAVKIRRAIRYLFTYIRSGPVHHVGQKREVSGSPEDHPCRSCLIAASTLGGVRGSSLIRAPVPL